MTSTTEVGRLWALAAAVPEDIKPQVEGYVRKQVYREGAYVRQGELMFLIDPRNYKAVADQARSTLDRNAAALAKADRQAQRQAEGRRTRSIKNLARERQSRFA